MFSYGEHGDPAGVPVVLLHAYTESWRSFELLLPHLPRSIHAFAVSERGHGDADKPPTDYALDNFSNDVAAFLDEVGVEAAVIVGSSSGGYIAQRFALDHPERTLGLVLVGSPRSLRGDPPPWLTAVAQLTDPVDPAFARHSLEDIPRSSAVLAAFLDTMVAESLKAPAHVWQATLQGLLDAVPPTETGTITAPTLILAGALDDLLPPGEQQALAAAIPGSLLVVYEDTGHLVLWEQPERVAADLTAFALEHGQVNP